MPAPAAEPYSTAPARPPAVGVEQEHRELLIQHKRQINRQWEGVAQLKVGRTKVAAGRALGGAPLTAGCRRPPQARYAAAEQSALQAESRLVEEISQVQKAYSHLRRKYQRLEAAEVARRQQVGVVGGWVGGSLPIEAGSLINPCNTTLCCCRSSICRSSGSPTSWAALPPPPPAAANSPLQGAAHSCHGALRQRPPLLPFGHQSSTLPRSLRTCNRMDHPPLQGSVGQRWKTRPAVRVRYES